VISFVRVRVISLFTDVVKSDFFFALICLVKNLTNCSWTSGKPETSCKIILDNYNADPLFVLER